MRNYGVVDGMIRVNKTRARAMYNSGYQVMLAIGTEKDYLYKNWAFITYSINDDYFDHIVLDFYNMHKGNDVGYTVEYWVNQRDNKEYVREYNKAYQRKYKAKKYR